MTKSGINYINPEVTLLHATPLSVSEIASRCAYRSFSKSEHESIRDFPTTQSAPDIPSSELVSQLAHVYHHDSVLEHIVLQFSIRNMSRGVLQELSRHRIGVSPTVQSTRYTMSPILNAFVAEILTNTANTTPSDWFCSTLDSINFLVTTDPEYNRIQYIDIYNRLKYQYYTVSDFLSIATSKSGREAINGITTNQEIFDTLQSGKQVRNIGDSFKHLINDNYSVDAIYTFNLRALSHFYKLRDSNAAYFQIRELAQAMKRVTPSKYLDLIVKAK